MAISFRPKGKLTKIFESIMGKTPGKTLKRSNKRSAPLQSADQKGESSTPSPFTLRGNSDVI